MAKSSNIEWTDATFNPWIGCTKVSPACDHCYAEVSTPARTKHVIWGAGQERQRTAPSNWKTVERWNKQPFFQCAVCGRRGTEDELSKFRTDECRCYSYMKPARRRVFCASLADVFDNEVDPGWRIDLLDLIRKTPNLDWLLLTKRIGNVRKLVEAAAEATVGTGSLNQWLTQWVFARTPPANVWLGATIVNQEEADRDIPKLLATPARVRFLSMEPLLGPVDLAPSGAVRIELGNPDPIGRIINQREAFPDGDPDGSIDWIIVGGESGHGARPMALEWVRSLRDQCAAAGVPFLFKQWGEFVPAVLTPNPDDQTEGAADTPWRLDQAGRRWWSAGESTMPRDQWAPVTFAKPGKKVAGRTLDGRLHDGYPA